MIGNLRSLIFAGAILIYFGAIDQKAAGPHTAPPGSGGPSLHEALGEPPPQKNGQKKTLKITYLLK